MSIDMGLLWSMAQVLKDRQSGDEASAKLYESKTSQPDAYYIDSIGCAFLREVLGGIPAEQSTLYLRSMAILQARGYTEQSVMEHLAHRNNRRAEA